MDARHVLKTLDSLGCVPRVDGGRFVISNAKRIGAELRDLIKTNRTEIIELITPEADEIEEMDPVRCESCGGDCDVFVLPEWLCSSCDEGCQERRQETSRWVKHRKRIIRTMEANRG